MTGLKPGDAPSSLFFNIALEKVVRRIQKLLAEGIDIDLVNIKILYFADDPNILGKDI